MNARMRNLPNFVLTLLMCVVVLTTSTYFPTSFLDIARGYTRTLEFDFTEWAIDALTLKARRAALDAPAYLPTTEQTDLVLRYYNVVSQLEQISYQISIIYSNPDISDPAAASADLRAQQKDLRAERDRLAPLAEDILQRQQSQVLADLGLTTGGQPIPPVLYHVTPLPRALIISPRNVIRQDAKIMILPDMTLDEIVELEQRVERELNVSALVEPVGGIGLYPTMVQSTSNIVWQNQTIAHEWIHNYLTLRPLGLLYDKTPELRTMNETTASIAGEEIGNEVLRRYYPQYAPQPAPPAAETPSGGSSEPQPPAFNFGKEMHITRVHVDELLAAGKIDEAESYMEQRRRVFYENGYAIRRLNQAYFAFHGSYAADPGGGAAGEDPVGPAVRALRARSSSLAEFVNTIAGMTSFADLQKVVAAGD